MPFSNLDTKDSGILKMLNEDSRATTQAIADALNMPRVTVHDRIKRLQDRGVIDKFSVEINRRELGMAFAWIHSCELGGSERRH
jgi:Lrp/AsnC family leucine-responsive transcriptional regulator